MKKEGSIATAALLTIAAVVGFSVYPSGQTARSGNGESAAARPKTPASATNTKAPPTWCDDLTERLQIFLELKDADEITRPPACDYSAHDPTQSSAVVAATSHLKFVIALLPDPLHTHLPVLFDQFTGAIQEAGQDENYEFDSSWLPWQDQEPDYALLADRLIADDLKEMREKQPGVILFRKAEGHQAQVSPSLGVSSENTKSGPALKTRPAIPEAKLLPEYREGLIILVVAEEATHGIHRDQFRNALDWIYALAPEIKKRPGAVTILGPTFSGSLPSLAQLLKEPHFSNVWDPGAQPNASQPPLSCSQFAIYSGAVSSKPSADWFRGQLPKCPESGAQQNKPIAAQTTAASPADGEQPQMAFYSFVQDDETVLDRFCKYLKAEQSEFDQKKVALISEDETVYGNPRPHIARRSAQPPEKCDSDFLHIFYPRDISALRGAYQTKSIFDSGLPSQPTDTQRRSLPTDLADPAGEVHDSIKSYGGNQTPLVQEAFLLQMVSALRDFHARYLILRSSNSLDQVFLTNFLRRAYPDGRIVIIGSDLLFSRERGATGLSGTMTLSTYPLSPPARHWMDYAGIPSSDRVFSSDQSEGTYIALRLLLNSGPDAADGCHVLDADQGIFLPKVVCTTTPAKSPIPDYMLPFWLGLRACPLAPTLASTTPPSAPADNVCEYDRPATWLSAVGQNKLWPLAVLTEDTLREESFAEKTGGNPHIAISSDDSEAGRRPEMPLVMKVFWLILVAFAGFHAWCCWSGSLTAKPSFRAPFAGIGGTEHEPLLLAGSCCVAFLALITAFSCAAFSIPAYRLVYPWYALVCGLMVCALAIVSTVGASRCSSRLSADRLKVTYQGDLLVSAENEDRKFWRKNERRYASLLIGIMFLFLLMCVLPMEWALRPANHVLALWRGMNLLSGISWLVPFLALFAGQYAAVWFALHGLALFGPGRPCLPLCSSLRLRGEPEWDVHGKPNRGFLSMFSREDSQIRIEEFCQPWNTSVAKLAAVLALVFYLVAWGTVGSFPVRSLGSRNYALVVVLWLDLCCGLLLAETWRLFKIWENLRVLLVFLDRLPLRRTMASLHGFSWGSVWKMSGNVLEVRYKFLSRQLECMNHTIRSIEKAFCKGLDPTAAPLAQACSARLDLLRPSVYEFAATWFSNNLNKDAANLQPFKVLQEGLAAAAGHIFSQLLVPHWQKEGISLTQLRTKHDKSDESPDTPPLAKELYIQNAEEFVCLAYLAFVQNILGRIRTVTITVVVLFLAVAVAISSYPFDPRQALSAVLIAILAVIGFVIVQVYAGMHRDATLSHVTNTNPGELGAEFWFKLVGFGFAPVIGLLARIFPGITDFLFSWLQPSISSLK